MNITYDEKKRLLCIGFEGEIDHHTCLEMAKRVDDAIHKYLPSTVIFDFAKVSFMDSSGIGMLLGRYKKLLRIGATATIQNISEDIEKILGMSGIFKIIPLQEEVYFYG